MSRGGFLTDTELADLAAQDATQLLPVLVRCDQGRFTAATQDAGAIIGALEAQGWHVRDVELLSACKPADLVRQRALL